MPLALVVDDDKAFLAAIKAMLKEDSPSLQVETTTDGVDALRMLLDPDKRYDIAIIDVDMQPLTGDDLDTIIGILAKRGVIKTRVLMISGKVSERSGNYLAKPFMPEDLGTKVWEILDRNECE